MSESLKLPIGIENFEEIRREGFYYVDKTKLIEQLLRQWGKVNLFTRPRRFGKTLNMSMLRYFFEIGTDTTLFDGLEISRNREMCEEYQGNFPVVSVSLKNVDGLTFENAAYRLRELIGQEAERLAFLLDSDRLTANDKKRYRALIDVQDGQYSMDEAILKSSLQILSQLLYKYYGKKTIILIDEYDVPLDKAFQHGYYREMVDLIRGLFGQALKAGDTNAALHAGLAMVSEDRKGVGLLLDQSIEDNIVFNAMQVHGDYLKKIGPFTLKDSKAIRETANAMIQELDIRCFGPIQAAGTLSGGNQQKVCIARALCMKPKFLFVSEPTRGIDIGAKKLVLETLVKLNREQGMTVVIVSSELQELRSISDRIAIVSEGKLVDILAPDASDADFGLAMSGIRPGDHKKEGSAQ